MDFLENTQMAKEFHPIGPTNSLGVTSLISAIIGWFFYISILCVNFVLIPIGVVATMGLGIFFYCCTIPITCLPPICWLVGILTGRIGLTQIRQTGQTGEGLAKAGLVASSIGMGFIILSICAVITLQIMGVSVPYLEEIMSQIE